MIMDLSSQSYEKLKPIFDAFTPPKRQTIQEWIEENISVLASAAALPGPYKFAKTPYLKGIVQAIEDPRVRKITFQKSAQVGASELSENLLSYFIAEQPGPIMWVLPIASIAKKYAKTRLIPKLKNTPAVFPKCDFSHLGGSTNDLILFQAGSLTITNSGSEASLRSTPARVAIFDEVDGAKRGREGSPVALVEERLTSFKNSKLFLLSTPGLAEDSFISPLFEQSDKRFYFVKCPHCSASQRLVWDQVKWSLDKSGKPKNVMYHCSSCASGWSERERKKCVLEGEWRATEPFHGHAGFHISQLYSLFRPLSYVVDKFLEDESSSNLVRFYNTCLGLPYSSDSNPVSTDDLLSRQEDFNSSAIPNEVKWLCLTVDTQLDRYECLLSGFGKEQEMFLLSHTVLDGSPDDPELQQQIVSLFEKPYTKQNGEQMFVSICGIDAKGGFTGAVLAFCHEQAKYRRKIFATMGSSGYRPLISRTPKTSEVYKAQGYKFFALGVDTSRDMLFSRLKIEKPGPKYIHISNTIPKEAVEQLRNEVPAVLRRGGKLKTIWKTLGRNELWDLAHYGICLLYGSMDAYKRACLDVLPPVASAVRKSSYLERMRGDI